MTTQAQLQSRSQLLTRRRAQTIRTIRDLIIVLFTFGLLLVYIFPFLWIVLTSIRPADELFSDTFRLLPSLPSVESYQQLLNSDFPLYIANSLLICTVATLIAVIFSVSAAYSFSRRNFRGHSALLLLVVFSQLFPWIVLVTPLYVIFNRLGLVNTRLGLIIAYTAITVPFSVYMLLGYFENIPRELDEAAIIDGCSTLSVIWRIILPVAWPGVAATAIYGFAQAWNEFLFALTLVTSNDLKTIPVGLASFFGEFSTRWDLVMAASTIATLPTLIVFLLLQRQLVSGLAAGAVKQ
ncbi:MAG: carbohydrate ABC transporter permease [Anaerolineae bacterium]|nr:carbohydrate ABC transporter permease [Anaerolineae bacterium]